MDRQRLTILCVDDEQSILNALKRLLRKEKYRLLFANSGPKGLELLESNKVHLVISDQRMPEMSGTEFLSAVKQNYPDVVRVILTGYSDIDSITESINKGNIYKFFFKPWDDLKLKSEIRNIMDRQASKHKRQKLDQKLTTQYDEMNEVSRILEKKDGIRARELALKNHMLQLSHAILEDLPISVLVIDIEGIIVTANKTALNMLRDLGVQVGRAFSEFFPESASRIVSKVFESGERVYINGRDLNFKDSRAMLLPLSGDFKGKGVIMTMDG